MIFCYVTNIMHSLSQPILINKKDAPTVRNCRNIKRWFGSIQNRSMLTVWNISGLTSRRPLSVTYVDCRCFGKLMGSYCYEHALRLFQCKMQELQLHRLLNSDDTVPSFSKTLPQSQLCQFSTSKQHEEAESGKYFANLI